MEYRQFIQLLEHKSPVEKETPAMLQEFLKEFPYCQTAHLLLTRSMHLRQHVGFEKQLKLASAYAGDRKQLQRIVHARESDILSTTGKSDISQIEIPGKANFETVSKPEIPVQEKERNPFTIHDDVEQPAHDIPVFSLPESSVNLSGLVPDGSDEVLNSHSEQEQPVMYREWYADPENMSEVNVGSSGTKDPREVLKARLQEILGDVEASFPKEKEIEEPVNQTESNAEKIQDRPPIPEIVDNESPSENSDVQTHADPPVEQETPDLENLAATENLRTDPIARFEVAHILEESILESIEKLPEVERSGSPAGVEENRIEEQDLAQGSATRKTFYDWLKANAIDGFGRVEEVHAYDQDATTEKVVPLKQEPVGEDKQIGEQINKDQPDEEGGSSKEQLIERFIATAPRIVPVKAEFYSPVAQAKKSITEDEELVSETLAKIYKDQGFMLKARSSYEKLILLYPGKKGYFAALIQEIDSIILNNPNKEDL